MVLASDTPRTDVTSSSPCTVVNQLIYSNCGCDQLILIVWLQRAVLDGYGWFLKDQTSRISSVNKFLRKVPEYQVKNIAPYF
jgi:hypothetical protein